MNKNSIDGLQALSAAMIVALATQLGACDGNSGSGTGAAQPAANTTQAAPAAQAAASDSGAGPDINQLAQIVIEKINLRPEVEGAATLVEFKQISAKTEVLGDMGLSTVLECAGVVTFSKEVEWNWQGGTVKPGESAKFEVQAEYVNPQNKGWQLVEPIGIYAL